MQYNITNREGNRTISVFLDDGTVRVVAGTSPTFGALLTYLATNEEHDGAEVARLIDPAIFIGSQMAAIAGERITYDLHNLYFDGKPLHNAISTHVKAKIQAGDSDWQRLIKFMLNLDENPSYKAQQETYNWVQQTGLTLTEDGCFLGYKGISADMKSVSSGPDNYIDGVYYGEPGKSVRVPHEVGTVVSKKRADVDDTPGGGCSVGLHVGTYNYAKGFGQVLMTVKVNPRDVVSVPSRDSEWKIRVCRYEVVAFNEKQEDFIGKTTSMDFTPTNPDDNGDYAGEQEESTTAETTEKGWKVVEQDAMGYTILEAFYTAKDAEEALEGWLTSGDGDYMLMSPEGEVGELAADFEDGDLSPKEQTELAEKEATLSAEPEDPDVDPMAGLDPQGSAPESAQEDAPASEVHYASLAVAEAANDQRVLNLLRDTRSGHKPTARALEQFVTTTESSVRRWRKAHGVVLS